MRKNAWMIFFLCGFFFYNSSAKTNTLTQLSTIDGLISGLYDGTMSIGQLKNLGSFGIGTFSALNGEMVMFDSKCYRISSDGAVAEVTDTVFTPFAAVTTFKNDQTIQVARPMSYAELCGYIDSLIPSTNLFYAVRIAGTFATIKTRSVPLQSKPYPILTEVVKTQPTFEFNHATGTLIGFRCPTYTKGISVPGYHFHFISSDLARGGHLLDCSIKKATVRVDCLMKFELILPQDRGFYDARFGESATGNIEKVEK